MYSKGRRFGVLFAADSKRIYKPARFTLVESLHDRPEGTTMAALRGVTKFANCQEAGAQIRVVNFPALGSVTLKCSLIEKTRSPSRRD